MTAKFGNARGIFTLNKKKGKTLLDGTFPFCLWQGARGYSSAANWLGCRVKKSTRGSRNFSS